MHIIREVTEVECHPNNMDRKEGFLTEQVIEASCSNTEGILKRLSLRKSDFLLLDSTVPYNFLFQGLPPTTLLSSPMNLPIHG
jgi:hypothetical protein